jgi:hypothetical protein
LPTEKGNVVTPEMAVAQLIEIMNANANPDFSEDDIYEAMAQRNIPFGFADRAFKFTQIACGRVFLNGMGIKFSPDYFCLDAWGNILDSGELSENTYFIAALQSIPKSFSVNAFKWFAMTGAEFNAVNSALNNGSKPEDLTTASPILFMEFPTEEGLQRSRQLITESITRLKESDVKNSARSKPWWRFWN